jgi:general secretion pathway protein J
MTRSSTVRQKGFTLLEIIIAIAIFSLLGLACNNLLQTVLQSSVRSKELTESLQKVSQSMSLMEGDFSQWVARPMRTSASDMDQEQASFYIHRVNSSYSDSQYIEFFHQGFLNPQSFFPRGEVQRVAYRLRDNKLQRLSFPYPEPAPDQEPLVTEIFEQVTKIEYFFYKKKQWKPHVSAKSMPQAIMFRITFEDEVSIERKFLVLSESVQIEQPNTPAKGGQSSAN